MCLSCGSIAERPIQGSHIQCSSFARHVDYATDHVTVTRNDCCTVFRIVCVLAYLPYIALASAVDGVVNVRYALHFSFGV